MEDAASRCPQNADQGFSLSWPVSEPIQNRPSGMRIKDGSGTRVGRTWVAMQDFKNTSASPAPEGLDDCKDVVLLKQADSGDTRRPGLQTGLRVFKGYAAKRKNPNVVLTRCPKGFDAGRLKARSFFFLENRGEERQVCMFGCGSAHLCFRMA